MMTAIITHTAQVMWPLRFGNCHGKGDLIIMDEDEDMRAPKWFSRSFSTSVPVLQTRASKWNPRKEKEAVTKSAHV